MRPFRRSWAGWALANPVITGTGPAVATSSDEILAQPAIHIAVSAPNAWQLLKFTPAPPHRLTLRRIVRYQADHDRAKHETLWASADDRRISAPWASSASSGSADLRTALRKVEGHERRPLRTLSQFLRSPELESLLAMSPYVIAFRPVTAADLPAIQSSRISASVPAATRAPPTACARGCRSFPSIACARPSATRSSPRSA